MKYTLAIIVIIILVIMMVGMLTVTSHGIRETSSLENIKGMPYPKTDEGYLITEKLAHADLYLPEPVLGKQIRIRFNFTPLKMKELSVGVRENPFWLSYQPIVFYRKDEGGELNDQTKEAEVVIPLSDKIKDKNDSVDLMFFSKYNGAGSSEYEGENDHTLWVLNDWQVTIEPVMPTWREAKDYIKAVITRERPV